MPNVSNPDNDLMTAQQERDLRHPLDTQPEQARKRKIATADEKIETDLISNEGVGLAFDGRPKSETEQAMERARAKAREQAPRGRRGRGR